MGAQHEHGVSCAAEQARTVLQETRQSYIAIDEQGRVQEWNRAAADLFGYGRAEAVGRPLDQLIVPEGSRRAHLAGVEQYRATGRGRGVDGRVEVEAVRADGTPVHVELTIWAQQTPSGTTFHALATDLSERHAHQRMLTVLAEHRRGLLFAERPDDARRLLCDTARRAAGSDAAYLYEHAGAATAAEPCLLLTGQSLGSGAPPAAVVGSLPLALLGPPCDDVWIADALGHHSPAATALSGTGLRSFTLDRVDHDGELLGVLVLGWTAPCSSPPAERALLRLLASEAALVVERLAMQQQLQAAAGTDALTGVLNRRALDEHLARELLRAAREGKPLTVALLDLDGFKQVNDRLGHLAGDDLLVRAARAWGEQVRAGDLLARFGGDEFALLLPGADEDTAREVVRRVAAATPSPVTVTSGSATWHPGEGAPDLLGRADAALYEGKRRARGSGGGSSWEGASWQSAGREPDDAVTR